MRYKHDVPDTTRIRMKLEHRVNLVLIPFTPTGYSSSSEKKYWTQCAKLLG